MSAKKRGLSWRSKLFLLIALFAVLPLVALAYWILGTIEDTFRASTLQSLEAIATAKAQAIEQLTGNRRRDVERIATLLTPHVAAIRTAQEMPRAPAPAPPESLPQLPDAEALPPDREPTRTAPVAVADAGVAQQPEAATEQERQEASSTAQASTAIAETRASLRQTLGLILWDQTDFEELLVIDSQGRVIASTFAEHEGSTAANLAYFQNGLRATYVEPVFRSPITGGLTMVISTPIRDGAMQEVGVLAARLNLRRLFDLINDATGLGDTGETVVARVLNDELVFMAPTRHDPDAALNRRSPIHGPDVLPVVEASRGQSGSGVRRDYREESVLAAWRPVPLLEWGVVVKMDETEAMAHAQGVRARTLQISLGILVLALLASFFVAREFVRPLWTLKEATDRISRGDFDVKLAIRSGDEVGELADSFERMIAAIKFFRAHARSADEDDVDEEVDAAIRSVESDRA